MRGPCHRSGISTEGGDGSLVQGEINLNGAIPHLNRERHAHWEQCFAAVVKEKTLKPKDWNPCKRNAEL